MATIWYTLPGGAFGFVEDSPAPPGATPITEAAYNLLQADFDADNVAAAAGDQAAAEAKFVQAFQALRATGMSGVDAQLLAATVGPAPAGFNPVTQVFTPIHVFVQSPVETFAPHVITAAAGAFEKITEFDDMVIAEPGLYLVTWTVRGVSVIPGGIASVNTGTTAAIYRDDIQVAGTETMLELTSQGGATTTEPSLQGQSSGSGGMVMSITAGQALSIYAKRSNATGTNSITSDDGGRSRITAVRLRL